ncbi:uncharacterized protein LOC141695870 [Apium graveolens]|uniref:uncharacterized protein LOC141695870 n=1 Tax=Apium graveolens TaxID=4045 RepID=UPI003D79FE85
MFKARNYCVVGSSLYRRSLSEPLLRCLTSEKAQQAMVEVHTSICGEHLGGKNLALKIIKQGLYWPIIRKDYEEFVRKCQACQLHGNVSYRPMTELNSILAPCPFFPVGDRYCRALFKVKILCQYIVVAVDYATKWVEAKPLSKIREKKMIKFFHGVCCVSLWDPKDFSFRYGTQFVGAKLEKALEELKIQYIKASVAYPQANGLAEVTNRTILQGLKKELKKSPVAGLMNSRMCYGPR